MHKIYTKTLLFIFISLLTTHLQAQIPDPTEEAAMFAFLGSGTGFDPSWNIGNPIPNWVGVDTIDVGGGVFRIRKIDITGLGINALIPNGFIDKLPDLAEFLASDNFLNVDGSSWMTVISDDLQVVDISFNDFTNYDPVMELLIYGVNLTNYYARSAVLPTATGGSLPTVTLNSLIDLDLGQNQLFASVDLGNYPSLDRLWIDSNQIFQIISGVAFAGPKEIDCSFNNITDVVDLQNIIKENQNLQVLRARSAMDLNGSYPFTGNTGLIKNFTGNIATTYQNLYIDVGQNNLFGPAALKPIGENARVILVDHNQIDGLDFGFNPLNNLEILDASFNQIFQPDIELFMRVPNIQEYYLNDNVIEGKLPDPNNIGLLHYSLKSLRALDISNNLFDGDLHMDWFLRAQMDSVLIANAGAMFVEEVRCSNNNFHKVKMIDTLVTFPVLREVTVDGNILDFKELYRLTAGFHTSFQPVGTSFYDHHILNGAPLDSTAFLYYPQQELGIGGVKRRPLTTALTMDLEIGETPSISSFFNQYEWTRSDSSGSTTEQVITVEYDGALITNDLTNTASGILSTIIQPGTGDEAIREDLRFNGMLADHDGWLYQLCASNGYFPLLEVCNKPKKIIVGACYDSLGQEINCQQFMVELDTTYSEEHMDSVRNAIGVHKIDSCLCGTIELWEMNDTTNQLEVEAYGRGTRTTTAQSSNKAELLSADVNHALLDNSILTGDEFPASPSGTTHPSPTLVALIDSGTDFDHPQLRDRIWINPDDANNDGIDDDGNCVIDDRNGYNFLENTNYPYDDHGHGTNAAGIIAGLPLNAVHRNLGTYDSLAIIPLKYTDKTGAGSCFHAACAIRYAADYMSSGGDKVRVINASWGYYGDPNTILENQLRYAADNCDMLFVTSAGNDGIDNDTTNHYPSDFDLDNILVVGAVDNLLPNQLAGYSNYGANDVDIVTRGTYTTTKATTTILSETELATGTSFATAQVSRAAGLLFHEYPSASYRAVKQALMDGVDVLNSADSTKVKSKGRLNYNQARTALAANTNRSACMPSIAINIRLEGAIDTTTAFGAMRNDLVGAGVFPTLQPFNRMPWNYTGTETVDPFDPMFTGADALVDWVLVEVESADTTIRRAMLCQRDGDLVETDGSTFEMPNLPNESYKISVIHRNHLGIATLNTITLELPFAAVNFSDTSANAIPLTPTYEDMGGYRVMISGDASADGQINAVDKNAFYRLQLGLNGYEDADLNLDAKVNAQDLNLWKKNISKQSECINCYEP
jgi:Leucine-rich repeat (LRR) protein